VKQNITNGELWVTAKTTPSGYYFW